MWCVNDDDTNEIFLKKNTYASSGSASFRNIAARSPREIILEFMNVLASCSKYTERTESVISKHSPENQSEARMRDSNSRKDLPKIL